MAVTEGVGGSSSHVVTRIPKRGPGTNGSEDTADEHIVARREELLTDKRQELAKLLEEHDTAVRELFHLDRFVSLVSYNPGEAKKDTSQVFESFRARFDLFRLGAVPTAPAGTKARRTTRGAVDTLRQQLGAAVTAQHVAESRVPPTSSRGGSRGRGRGHDLAHAVSPSQGVEKETDVTQPPQRGMRGRGRGRGLHARASLPDLTLNGNTHSDIESEDEVDEIEDDGAPQIVKSGSGSQIRRSRSIPHLAPALRGDRSSRRGRGGSRRRVRVSMPDIRAKAGDDALEIDELEEEDSVITTTPAPQPSRRGVGRRATSKTPLGTDGLKAHSPSSHATARVRIRGQGVPLQLTRESPSSGEELTQAPLSPMAESDRNTRGRGRSRGGPLGRWKGWVVVPEEGGVNSSNLVDDSADGDTLGPLGRSRVLGRKHKPEDAPAGRPPPLKKIKLIHRVPAATYTHHEQIPSTPLSHPGKIRELLSSFYRLEEDGPDMTLEELENLATEGGRRLRRIAILRSEGRLNGPLQGPVKRQVEPPRPTGPWDDIIEQAIAESKANREAGRARVNISRRIARMIMAHWEKVAGADDKERKAEEKRLNILAKTTLKVVLAQWKEAVRYIRQKKIEEAKAEHARLGKEHLDAIIEHSTQALHAQRTLGARESRSVSSLRDSDTPSEDSESEVDDSSDEDGVEDDDDGIDLDDEVVLELVRGEDGDRQDYEEDADNQFLDSPLPVTGSTTSEKPPGSITPSESRAASEFHASTVKSSSIPGNTRRRVSFRNEADATELPPFTRLDDTNGVTNGHYNRSETGSTNDDAPNDSQSPAPIPLKGMGEARSKEDGVDHEFASAANANQEAEDEQLAAAMEAEDSGSDDGELNALEQEAELPLEELLRQYGYVPREPSESGKVQQGDETGSAHSQLQDQIAESGNDGSERTSMPADNIVTPEVPAVGSTSTPDVDPAPAINRPTPDSSPPPSRDDSDHHAPKKEPTDEEMSDVSDAASLGQPGSAEDDESTIRPPFLLRGTLRPYQQAGLEWLVSLYLNEHNGILADEMGLGKTIQTIALLAWLACVKGIWGPHLIVVPTSVLKNWEMEFKKFLPGFKIIAYYGNVRERKERRHGWKAPNAFHVCITSYQLILTDQHIFRRMPWVYMILDEAHNIKNFKSQRWQDLFTFRPHRRLLLTGTPLQNNLMELWALMHFLNPVDAVGYRSDFADWFSKPMDRALEDGRERDDENQERVNKLHTLLRPYLLRRMKADVEKELPAKYEHLVYCRLSKRQRFLYDEFMARSETKEILSSGNFLSVVNCLMQLRKVCNHPDLFEVRPIVTSFAMQRSAVADYEIKELLVRRRLLHNDLFGGIHSAFSGITAHEDSSLIVSNTRRYLDASSHLPHVKEIPGEPPPRDVRTIDGFRRYQEYQHSEAKYARWRHITILNRQRCSVRPVYGRELLSTVSSISQLHSPFAIHSSPSRVNHWAKNELLLRSVKSYRQRVEAIAPLVNRFAFATPPVVARDLPPLALREVQEPLSRVQFNRDFDSFHFAAVKLQIAFPDPSLLQYDCGKLQELDLLLKERRAGGHRALIFTQMTRVLDILEIFLNFHGYRYLRLDGSTKIEDRQKITQRFNMDTRILCFISSSRSGGVGINLTGADTVIFYDSDYNPSMDRQCEDRAHRIGQIRDVHIYRFISKHTVEEAMLRKANQKRSLDDMVIRDGEFDWRKVMISDIQMEQALEQVEDIEDARAARNAAAEMYRDSRGEQQEFDESVLPISLGVSANDPTPGMGEEDEEQDQLEGLSGVERYMIQLVENDWSFFSEWRIK